MVGLVGANHWPAGDWEWAFCARWTISGVRFAAGTDCHRLGTGGVVGTFELTQIIAPQWVLPFGEDTIRCHICARGEVGKVQWVFVNTVGHFPFISCGG